VDYPTAAAGLAGGAINGLFGAKWPNKIVNTVGAFLHGTFVRVCGRSRPRNSSATTHKRSKRSGKNFFDWIVAGNFRAGFDLQMDQLTVVMVLVVTGVGFLIHIYSTGYMSHERRLLSLLCLSESVHVFMLILVLAANYVLLFVGWEGVGLSSYLLIGFYFLRKSGIGCRQESLYRESHRGFCFMLGMFLLSEHSVRLTSRNCLKR